MPAGQDGTEQGGAEQNGFEPEDAESVGLQQDSLTPDGAGEREGVVHAPAVPGLHPSGRSFGVRAVRALVSREPFGARLRGVYALAALLAVWFVLAHRPHAPEHRAVVATPVAQQSADPAIEPPGIVLHDSDTPGRMHGRLVGRAHIEETEREDHPNWRTVCDGKVYHIGYHYVIRADGVVEKGRPDDCLGTHSRTHNDWLGICMIGGFSTNRHWWPEQPTHAQMVALIALCERLMSRYHISPAYIKRHRDLNQTWCPGDRFPYRFLMRTLTAYAAAHPETRTPPNRVVSLAVPKRGQRRIYPRFLEGVAVPVGVGRSATRPIN